MRLSLLVVLALVVAGQAPSAQLVKLATPEEQRTLLSAQADSPLSVRMQAATVETLRYNAVSGIVITRAMDPQTVLCIEHQGSKLVWSTSNYLLTNPVGQPASENRITVPEAPKLPERTCHTVAQWLEKGR